MGTVAILAQGSAMSGLMEEPEPQTTVSSELQRKLQKSLDKTVVWPKARWVSCAVTLLLFAIRVVTLQAFFLIAYALAIYLLNILILFLSPLEDPEEGGVLPTAGEEFRPFER